MCIARPYAAPGILRRAPTDLVFLRDGSACGQADAADRVARDPSLLYPTRDAALRVGLARLRVGGATDRP